MIGIHPIVSLLKTGGSRVTKKNLAKSRTESSRLVPRITPVAAAVMMAIYPFESAQPQEGTAQEEQETIDEIITTGTRIRKDTFSSAAPMDVVVTETAAVKGINDVATLLQSRSIAAGAPQVTAAFSAAIGF